MKQQVIYNSRDQINEIILSHVCLDVHFKSQNNATKIITKVSLCYDFIEILKKELFDCIDSFFDYINSVEVFSHIPYHILVNVIKREHAFQIKEPILHLSNDFSKTTGYTIPKNQLYIKEYFLSIINIF